MKAIVSGLAAALLAAGAACAQPAAPAQSGGHVCLWTYMIDHTKSLDPKTLIFNMKNGDEWKNTLKWACPGLSMHGFAYVTHDGSICDNMQSIMVLETHQVCMLGAFTRYTEPPKPAAQ